MSTIRTAYSPIAAAVAVMIAAPVAAEPTRLSLGELDTVTAGTDGTTPAPNGGAIVGNGSSASLESSGRVSIADAQTDVQAMNFVNSSESAIANGVNVFDGSVDETGSFDDVQYDIEQQNVVNQDQRRLSSLPSYERGANTEIMSSETGSAESSYSSSVTDRVTDLERTVVIDERTTDGGVTSDGAPTLSLSGDIGDSVDVEAEFNYPGAGGGDTLGGVFNGGLDYELSAGSVETSFEGLTLNVELPSLTLNLEAMGCLVLNGDCTIDGTRTESTDEISDHSTLYESEESSSSAETWDNSYAETVNAAFELHNAQAEYIVVDESGIDVTASYLVELSGGAQSGLQALNAVNAAGSAVANGVNVARQSGGELELGGPNYELSQVNHINHSR